MGGRGTWEPSLEGFVEYLVDSKMRIFGGPDWNKQSSSQRISNGFPARRSLFHYLEIRGLCALSIWRILWRKAPHCSFLKFTTFISRILQEVGSYCSA
ncbi:hypothetical protein MLD38_012943 [Melastoma candidum]|uniref:Uncharacterized protein n=1 Tax=Melastoma candidum TaxID=119954 RepID=A0ACB9R7Y7_9MYRT|nr:hypothetical protein MLD38_012943 [Melastoma candidum]